MQSFKQYLQEDNRTLKYPTCRTYINFSISKIRIEKKQLDDADFITEPFKHLIQPNDTVVHFNTGAQDKIEIKTTITDESIVSSQESFMEYKKKLHEVAREVLKSNDTKMPFPNTSRVVCDGLPRIPVNVKNVLLVCGDDTKSLHDVNKLISCESFLLSSPHLIQESVLGILKMKSLKQMYVHNLTNSPPDEPEWFKIIKKYIESKDILACQEELIEAGLKAYAKL